MLIASWNVKFGRARVFDELERLGLQPDVLVVQEVALERKQEFRVCVARLLPHVQYSGRKGGRVEINEASGAGPEDPARDASVSTQTAR